MSEETTNDDPRTMLCIWLPLTGTCINGTHGDENDTVRFSDALVALGFGGESVCSLLELDLSGGMAYVEVTGEAAEIAKLESAGLTNIDEADKLVSKPTAEVDSQRRTTLGLDQMRRMSEEDSA